MNTVKENLHYKKNFSRKAQEKRGKKKVEIIFKMAFSFFLEVFCAALKLVSLEKSESSNR